MNISYEIKFFIGVLLIAGFLSGGCGDQNDPSQPPEGHLEDLSVLDKDQPEGHEERVSVDPNEETPGRMGEE